MKVLAKFTKKDLYSIPNILCYIRLIMIPIFLIRYISAETPREYMQAAILVLISGITDFLDGFIARTFQMVTDFGKLIDPLADKLTQAALIFVLVVKTKGLIPLLVLFVTMQLFMLGAGLLMLKKNKRLDGAKWFGKISTTVFYATMLLLVALPDLNSSMVNVLMLVCGGFLLLSFIMYVREYVLMYRESRVEGELLVEKK